MIMDHRETVADSICRMILYNLLCFASVPVFIFGRVARKITGINYQNPITESCHANKSEHLFMSKSVLVSINSYCFLIIIIKY